MPDSKRNVLTYVRENFDTGDKWGSTMGALFALAEIIRAETGEIVPDYRPAPSYVGTDEPGEYGEDLLTTDLWDALQGDEDVFVEDFEITLEGVQYAHGVLSRYEGLLRAEGHSY